MTTTLHLLAGTASSLIVAAPVALLLLATTVRLAYPSQLLFRQAVLTMLLPATTVLLRPALLTTMLPPRLTEMLPHRHLLPIICVLPVLLLPPLSVMLRSPPHLRRAAAGLGAGFGDTARLIWIPLLGPPLAMALVLGGTLEVAALALVPVLQG